LRCPANVLGDGTPSSLADRCHSLSSLHPPLAAVASLPLPYFLLQMALQEVQLPIEQLGIVPQMLIAVGGTR